MVNAGDVCTITRFGAALWVAMRQEPDGRWRLTGKRTDRHGNARFTSHTAGLGDITVITPAPTFAPGDEIEKDGLTCLVLEDRGGDVEVGVPASGKLSRGGDVIRIPSGNVRAISKCDLVLANFGNT